MSLDMHPDTNINLHANVVNDSNRNRHHRGSAIRSLAALGFLFVMAWLIACKGPEWKQYSHPEDGVAFSMPAEPILKQTSFEGDIGHGDRSSYRTDSSAWGGALYEVSVTTYTRDLNVKTSLENFENKLLAEGMKATENKRPISLQGYSGVELNLENDDTRERFRYYIVKNRVVGLFVIVAAGKSLPADADRFFNSVQLTDAAK